jgi:2-dehydro-3-deoxygluconokinase
VHLTGIGPAISESSYALAQHIAARAAAAGTSSSFDPNLRPQLWRSRELMIERINALATQAQWVLPGLEEGRVLTGRTAPADIAAFYLERGVRGVVVKLGADGAYLRTTQIEAQIPAAPVDEVLDTVGAGDGFAVGFISALLEGHEPQRAAARGTLIAGLAIRVIGDCEGLPTRAALEAAERGL